MKINDLEFDIDLLEVIHSSDELTFPTLLPHAKRLRTPDKRQLLFIDNGSPVLGIAHLDTTMYASHFAVGKHYNHPEDTCIFSPNVDDRLGAYTLLYLLPQVGVHCDILLSVGEEIGDPTSRFFNPPKQYNWMFQFDRRGTDVVRYQYTAYDWLYALHLFFGEVNQGMFSDISFMDHLNCQGVNIGTAYYDYTLPHGYGNLNKLTEQIFKFKEFYRTFENVHFHGGV